MARQSGQLVRKRKAQEVFLEALASGQSVTAAARKALASRAQIYVWRGEDPDFAERWDDAWAQRGDLLEQTAYDRAVRGWAEPVVSAGKHVLDADTGEPLWIHKYDSHLLQLLLKGAKPEVYRDRVEIATPPNLGITVILEQMKSDHSIVDAANDFLGLAASLAENQ